LPETVKQEGIAASYEKGVLTISIPKKDELVEKAPKQIAIK
jgi:HSP20 family molecular chaperone IbpA